MKKFLYMFSILSLMAVSSCEKSPKGGEDDSGSKNEPPVPPVETVTYKVGDFYKSGLIKGVVFLTDEQGEHGLLVSLGETQDVWSYTNEQPTGYSPETSGLNHTKAVWALTTNWEENFPGFYWCYKLNPRGLDKWYIPSQYELVLLYKAYSSQEPESEDPRDEVDSYNDPSAVSEDSRSWFNARLVENGGVALHDDLYWSSDEYGPMSAYPVSMRNGAVPNHPNDHDKKLKYFFRAVCRF